MNKKKIALTILLSTLLALLAAFCVLEFSKKLKLIETQTTTENEINNERMIKDTIFSFDCSLSLFSKNRNADSLICSVVIGNNVKQTLRHKS